MKNLMIVVGIAMALVAAYLVAYEDEALYGLFCGLVSAAIMIATSDSVWRDVE